MTRSAEAGALAARLFEQHGPAVRRYLRRLTGESTLADDLTQDVYVRVVRAAERYEPRERQAIGTDLNTALRLLEEPDREAFLLCELAGLRYDEIADMLGLTVASVRSRIYRARVALRSMLMPPGPLAPMHIVRNEHHDD